MKESRKIPNKVAAITDFHRLFFSENGNNKITGQHGFIPLMLSQSGDITKKIGKQISVKKINNLLLFLAIIFLKFEPNLSPQVMQLIELLHMEKAMLSR